MSKYVVCAFYHFTTLDDFQSLKSPLLALMSKQGIKGTLLLAREGINGTVSAKRAGIDHLIAWLKKDPRFAGLTTKESFDEKQPFYRTKVKLKKEIVTMGVEDIDPNDIVGTYVKPEQWNALISDPEVLLIDTRNDYEVGIGTFENAANPQTKTFREFPEYVVNNLNPEKHKKVAMFCTGGIRCEKSTAYLKQQGFDEVYHLQGGILNYLETIPQAQSMWQGECFVFDNRVAVNHQLDQGSYDQCFACRMPVTEEQKKLPEYQAGVSCHYCIAETDEVTKARFKERQKQVALARLRGEQHIGGNVATLDNTSKK